MANGFGIVALIALYFIVKWAVKNGIKKRIRILPEKSRLRISRMKKN